MGKDAISMHHQKILFSSYNQNKQKSTNVLKYQIVWELQYSLT